MKTIARNFWHILQKNKQYRDLPKILEALDIESAAAEGKTLVKVYSDKELSNSEINLIKEKINLHVISTPQQASGAEKSAVIPAQAGIQSGSPIESGMTQGIIIQQIIRPGLSGVEIKIGDQSIDLSLSGKVEGLRKAINDG